MSERPPGQWMLPTAIAVGLLGAGLFIGGNLHNIRRGDRYVTVKGLAEKDVTADLAVWTIKTAVTGNDLALTQHDLDQSVERMRGFLKTNGFGDDSVTTRGVRVVDRRTREYGDTKPDQARYILEATVVLRSTNVMQVVKVSQMTNDLVKAGVTLADDNGCSPGPSYLYTKLNDVKPAMLAEATKNARRSAEQFAADSSSALGTIRIANQGVFSITPRDQVSENTEGPGISCAPSDPFKKIRVVTTIDYYLER